MDEGGEVEQAGALVWAQRRGEEEAASFLEMAGGFLFQFGDDGGDSAGIAEAGNEFGRGIVGQASPQRGGVSRGEGIVVAFKEEGFDAGAEVGSEFGGAGGQEADFVKVVFDLEGKAQGAGEIVEAEKDGFGRAGKDGADEQGGLEGVTGGFEEVGAEDIVLGNLVERAAQEGELEGFTEAGILGDGGEVTQGGGRARGVQAREEEVFDGEAEEDVAEDEGEIFAAAEVGAVSETTMEGGLAAAGEGAVNNVVVNEGEGVEELEAAGDAVSGGGRWGGAVVKQAVGGE